MSLPPGYFAEACPVRVMGGPNVGHVVGAELLQKRLGKYDRDHRFADYRCGGHGATVRSLSESPRGLVSREIHGAQSLGDRRERLHRGGGDDGLPVGHATLQTAETVARADQLAVLKEDLVLNLAVGGKWPGVPGDDTPSPTRLQVRHVKVWQRPADRG